MPRQKIEPAHAHDPTDTAAVARGDRALSAMSGISAAIADQYGDGLPYDRARIVHEARFFQAQTAEAMLELGKRLIQLKENEPHGDFVEIVEEQLGINSRTAQRFMKAAVKFLLPGPKTTTLSLLGKSKLFELMDEDDEQLDELAKGGTLANLDLDDMQAMSARELRQALKEARQAVAAKDRVIEKKNKKIDEYQEAEEARRAAPAPERERIQLDSTRDVAIEAEMSLRRLVKTVALVVDAPATPSAELAARNSAVFVAQLFADLLNEGGINVEFEEKVTPHWLQPTAGASKRAKG